MEIPFEGVLFFRGVPGGSSEIEAESWEVIAMQAFKYHTMEDHT